MKKILNFFIVSMFALSIFSCEVEDESEDTPPAELLEINIETTSTQNSITLEWPIVQGCHWYFISYAITGQEHGEQVSYQDIYNSTLSYELSGLQKNTEYEIKMEGRDYLNGGKLLATKTIKASTEP